MTGADPNNREPPDPNGAVGMKSLIAVTNVQIEGLRKNGAPLFGPTYLSDMFTAFAPKNLFDPRIIYDTKGHRFIVVVLDTDEGSGDLGEGSGEADASASAVTESRILVAASKNGNPLSAGPTDWYFLEINSFVDNVWCDYPGLAVDDDAVYITGNMVVGDGYAKPLLWILPKRLLYSGTATATDVSGPHDYLADVGVPFNDDAYLPARRAGSYLVSVMHDNSVNVVRVKNPTTNAQFRLTNVPFQIGTGDSGLLPYPGAPQKGTTELLDAGDSRTLDVAWANNALWVTFDLTDGNSVLACWLKIGVSGPNSVLKLADKGCIRGNGIGPGTFTFYPSLDVNSKGVVAFGFAASSPSMYASAFATIRDDVKDPPRTVRQPQLVREGEAPYYHTPGSDNDRWGDYTGMSVDPRNDDCFWAFNQFAASYAFQDPQLSGVWETAWARLCYVRKSMKGKKGKNELSTNGMKGMKGLMMR